MLVNSGIMGICTIAAFRTALQFSDQYISSPRNIRANIQSITRSKHFVECEAVIGYTPAIIYAPISREALDMVLVANQAVAPARGDILSFEIHHNALHIDALQSVTCSLIVERLPKSYTPLCELICFTRRAKLISSLERLCRSFANYNISHNNLQISNIVVDEDNRWYPIRLYYATRGIGGDTASFLALRAAIDENAMRDDHREAYLCEEISSYIAMSSTHRVEPLKENRRRFMSDSAYGFKDESGNIVVAAQYSKVEAFEEGRAIVYDMNNRVGVIDRMGNAVIPTIYDDARFVVESGSIWVAIDGRWREFDYNGSPLGECCDALPFVVDDL